MALTKTKDYLEEIEVDKRKAIYDDYYNWYWKENLSLRETAKMMNVSYHTLVRYVFKYNLRRRTQAESQQNRRLTRKISVATYKNKFSKEKTSQRRLNKYWRERKKKNEDARKERENFINTESPQE